MTLPAPQATAQISFPIHLPERAPHISLRGPFSFASPPTLRPNSRDLSLADLAFADLAKE